MFRRLLVPFLFAASCLVPAPPASTAFEPLPADHAQAVASYTLRAQLDASQHIVRGTGTLHWTNTSPVEIRELWVHLYLNAFKNQQSVFLREPVSFRSDVTPGDRGHITVTKFAVSGSTHNLWEHAELRRPNDEDETDVRVPLPQSVRPGDSLDLEMAWESKLPSVVARTGYAGSFHMVGQWFPKLARLEPDGHWAHFPFHKLAEFYADYGNYDVTLDVPEGFVVGATGVLVDSSRSAGRQQLRYVQGDVHDFAWTAWDRFLTTTETIHGVAVTVLHPSGTGFLVARELRALRFALPYFSSLFGPYPYATLTVVHPPVGAQEAGGMEYPTLITTGTSWYESWVTRNVEHVTVHELGHQWFYGIVGSDETRWPVLDEGITEYATQRALRSWLGPSSALSVGAFRVDLSSVEAGWSHRLVHDQPVGQPAHAFDSSAALSALVYGRTAVVLETLARVYGEELFDRVLGGFARAQRFRHPCLEDLFQAVGRGLGVRAERVLRTALMEKGWVDYVATSLSTGGPKDGWVLLNRRGTLSFPVDIELRYADGSREERVWDGELESTRLATRPSLVAVVIDPHEKVLLDADRTNNHVTHLGWGGGAPRTLERALYWAALLVQAVTP